MHMDTPAAPARRHDLDALRAFAMLLGIVLHGALSFFPVLWPVQDSQQNPLFGAAVAAIHGFRMPVFFVMSGFFTAMLWRRRGLRSLLGHRFRRIVLPLLLGLVTVVPAVEWVSAKAIESASTSAAAAVKDADDDGAPGAALEATDEPDPATGLTPLSRAAAEDGPDSVKRLLSAGVAVDAPNRDGSTPLLVAALFGNRGAVELLIGSGADLDRRGPDGSTALHTAAFFGRPQVVRLLLDAGADATLRNGYGQTPSEVLAADWQTTSFFAQMVGVELEQGTLEASRAEIAELLSVGGDSTGAAAEVQGSGDSASLFRLLHEPFFHHLWFLWFLCWYVAGFALCVWAGGRFGLGSTAGWRRIALSPFRWLWLVPVTALPQALMGRLAPVFGADTSAGLLPMPHVLVFYGLFFAFGALYFEAGDVEGKVGRGWFLTLPLGLFVLFPIGLGLTFSGLQNAEPAVRVAAALVQGAYPWVMLFGLMGLSRRVLGSHRPWVRYLSDASYWLYLAHLPLILGAQLLVRDWNLPASVKLTLVCVGVTVILMGIYRVAVRYTWLGRLLNGPRERPVRPAAPRPV